MNLTLTIQAENPAELADAIKALTTGIGAAPVTDAPVKKTPKGKNEVVSETVNTTIVRETVAPAATETEEPVTSTTPAATTEVTKEMVRELVVAKKDQHRDAIKEILKECDAKNVESLQPAKLGYFYNKVKAL